MIEDATLFKYELAIVAILKNEAPYIKEWIDYHLLAGVEHFYLYDNESEDNLKEILQPYIDKNLITYEYCPGKAAQLFVYNKAIQQYKFDCRYMAFIDGDEFIFPKDNKTIMEVLHAVLDDKPFAAGLAINWHAFGSSGQDEADLTRGVLERFKYRIDDKTVVENKIYNAHVKTIANPRYVDLMCNPHFCNNFLGVQKYDENGEIVINDFNYKMPCNKIIINHYHTKSKAEYIKKVNRGNADLAMINTYKMGNFEQMENANKIYDEEILKYKDFRQSIYVEPNNNLDKINKRRCNAIFNILAPTALFANFSPDLSRVAPPFR